MAKKDLKDLLGKKSPAELRKGIQQIDILKEASEALSLSEKESDKADVKESSVEATEQPDDKKSEVKPFDKISVESSSVENSKTTEDKKRTSKSSDKTEHVNRSTSRRKPKVFSSKDIQAVLEVDKRATERYSFEIYSDQKGDIEQVCKLYEKATGKKLSASRLIREVLDTFLPDALKTFDASVRETPGE
jgi:hypothetical protein